MKLIKSLSLFLTLLSTSILSSYVMAQAPVVGVEDPESLFVDSDPVLHKNKQSALRIMRELLQCNHWSDAGNWITDRYIQHNPNAASGLKGVVDYFTATRERTPTCTVLTTPVVAVQATDDLVTVIIAREYTHPVTGEAYTSTWFDTWRFVDGKADEHWDPATVAQ